MDDSAKAAAFEDGRTAFGLSSRTASALCYVAGWVSGLFFLLVERRDRDVRFHAIHSLVVFLPVNLAIFALFAIAWFARSVGFIKAPLLLAAVAAWGATGILWAWLMYATYRGDDLRIPWSQGFARRLGKLPPA